MTALRISLAVTALAIVAVIAALIVWAPFGDGRPEVLRLSSGSAGGTYAAFADAVAEVLAEKGGPSIAVLPSSGATQNAARLARGEADFALIQSDTVLGAGSAVVARLFPEAFHLVVREGAGIAGVKDLRGRRVGTMPEGSGSAALFQRLLNHYEVGPTALTLVPGNLSDHAAAIAAGEIDAFFMVVALGNTSIEAIIDATPTQLISIDQSEALAMFDPAFRSSTVPVGTYSGERPVPAEPIEVVTVDSLLAVRGGLSEPVVEEVVRLLFENRQALVRRLPQAAFIAAPDASQALAFGLHPGAARHFERDAPPFVVEYAEPIALGVTAFALLISGLWQARIFLAGARKNRADHYNLAIIDILGRVEEAGTPEAFVAIRAELHEIFQRVIVDLDNDRIEEKSLQSFSFAWQAAASSLNHRQLLLEVGAPVERALGEEGAPDGHAREDEGAPDERASSPAAPVSRPAGT